VALQIVRTISEFFSEPDIGCVKIQYHCNAFNTSLLNLADSIRDD